MERSAARRGGFLIRAVALVVTLTVTSLVSCARSDDNASPSTGRRSSTTTGSGGTRPSSGADASGAKGKPFDGYGNYASKQYKGTQHWICHPRLTKDPCRDLDTTVIQADGSRQVKRAKAADHPAIDCFYVYPTASDDPSKNSDFNVDASEIGTVRAQAARYASVCRVFAPAYRQITLQGLGSGFTPAARNLAYGDVLDAWKTYITRENSGRGVVLIGHSQGAGILAVLLKAEIDGNAKLRPLLLSAILLGTSVSVPKGKVVGGDLKNVPGCTSADQTGCVISYSSYPAAQPPKDGAIFGRSASPGQRSLCVDPTDLAGGNGRADTVLPTNRSLLGGVQGLARITTPYASLPGALVAACTEANGYTFLGYKPAGGTDRRPVAALLNEQLGPAWGLHLLDANLAQDDLISVVRREAKNYKP